MEKNTGFDEDFFWENVNLGFENISKCIQHRDIKCLYTNTAESRRKYASQLASLILQDERIRQAECDKHDHPAEEDSILSFTAENERKIFEHFFTQDPFKSVVFSDVIECELYITEHQKFWLLSTLLTNVDTAGPIPEFLKEAELKKYKKMVQPLVQTYCQKFTMAYEVTSLEPESWDPSRLRFWRWDMQNPHNPSHDSIVGLGQGLNFHLKHVDNVEMEEPFTIIPPPS